MALRPLALLVLTHAFCSKPSLALKINNPQEGSKPLTDADCKTPASFKQWWLIIDGKDANRGAHAYDDHGNYGPEVLSAMKFMGTTLNDGPVNLDLVQRIAAKVGKSLDKMTGHPATKSDPGARTARNILLAHDVVAHDVVPAHPARNIQPMCSNMMSCEETQGLVEGLPDFAFISDNNTKCPRNVLPGAGHMKPAEMQKILSATIAMYNADLEKATDRESTIRALATFLRNYMWVHPYEENNGRAKTVLMHREVRRLGLACGAILWNNNKVLYVDSLQTFVDKLKYGMQIYEQAVSSEQNPWLDQKVQEDFHAKFPYSPGKKACEDAIREKKKDFEKFGDIK